MPGTESTSLRRQAFDVRSTKIIAAKRFDND